MSKPVLFDMLYLLYSPKYILKYILPTACAHQADLLLPRWQIRSPDYLSYLKQLNAAAPPHHPVDTSTTSILSTNNTSLKIIFDRRN